MMLRSALSVLRFNLRVIVRALGVKSQIKRSQILVWVG